MPYGSASPALWYLPLRRPPTQCILEAFKKETPKLEQRLSRVRAAITASNGAGSGRAGRQYVKCGSPHNSSRIGPPAASSSVGSLYCDSAIEHVGESTMQPG